ncbi:spore cortex biosynthesis protein YabQ [Bacillus mesophilus]|uniref:Spore cortex biosynthesis protein YabQ n=1 Tax=Bacillus mesophilus TaxID=1808955 RepID=A0A6M0QFE7_9BACI|nr:spore cortex biosynthesis protein YabQ [Bacillus mesophilus]MBM7663432.1 spore cortex biosynthesis protein YabQ [Bacillus mesophilus]NEY74118.1 spore cortex biosynthesis protein YabQ [Bacillus mesophilus]
MSLTVQFYTMLAMFGMGSWVGAALDTYGRFLKRSTRASWFVFLNDIAFWVVQGLIIFYTLLVVNEGELRFYVFLALLCGFAAYQSLFQSFYKSLLERLISMVVKTYKFFARLVTVLIINPIRYIIQLLLVFLLGLWKLIMMVSIFIVKVIYTPFKWVGLLIWKLTPKKFKIFLNKIAGFLMKIKNFKNIWQKWLSKFRR